MRAGDRKQVYYKPWPNLTVLCSLFKYCNILCVFVDDEAVSVNGTFLQVPDIANTEVKLCVSFQYSSSSDRIIVLVHHRGDPKKLSAYFMNTSNCTTAPTPGVYVVGVFTQSHDSTLKPPASPPTISVGTVPISEYYYIIF